MKKLRFGSYIVPTTSVHGGNSQLVMGTSYPDHQLILCPRCAGTESARLQSLKRVRVPRTQGTGSFVKIILISRRMQKQPRRPSIKPTIMERHINQTGSSQVLKLPHAEDIGMTA